MAIICYAASAASSGSPYATWATAATSFATALAAASSGDTVQVDMTDIASGDAEVAGTTAWEIPDGVTVHIGTQSGASGITTGIMGTTYWFGNSTTGRTLRVRAIGRARIIGGLTLRTGSFGSIAFNWYQVGSMVCDELYAWHSATSGDAYVTLGHSSAENYTYIGKLTVDNDDTSGDSSKLECNGVIEIGKLLVNLTDALALPGYFYCVASTDTYIYGGDISSLGSGETLATGTSNGYARFFLSNVILPASFAMQTSQTNNSRAGGEITLQDCSSSGSAVPFAYANACGEVRVDTGIYLTAGTAGHSAKITTTSVCTPRNPFVTPWFNQYVEAATVDLSSQVLRDGSTTAYTDAEFWKETLTKETSSSVEATVRTTRGTGTNIPTGAGLGSWTGESGTAWSGEITIDSVVVAEDGLVRQRFGAGVASSTIYVDIGPVS